MLKILDQPVPKAISLGDALRLLNHHRVPHHLWGQDGRRSLEEFMAYATKDRFHPRDGRPAEDPLIVDVHVIVVRVYHQIRGRMLELFEKKQVCKGHTLRRDNFDGIAETRSREDHSLEIGARRCLKEELRFDDPQTYDLSPCVGVEIRDPLPSEKWPDPERRLCMVFHRHIHECLIDRSIFDYRGYEEYEAEHDRRIFFRWKVCQRAPIYFSK